MTSAGPEWSRLGPPRRRPRTVFDWMFGLSIVAIVLAVVLPRARYALRAGEAREVLAAVYTVQGAARRAAEAGDWFALSDARPGEIPEGLRIYLPEDFTFERADWSIDWDLYELDGRLSTLIVGQRHGGITVSFDSPDLADHVEGLAGSRAWVRVDDHLSFLVPTLERSSEGRPTGD